MVALGDSQEQAILTTAVLKRIGIYPIIARATNPLYAYVLKLVGADQVVIVEEQAGIDVAKRLLMPEIQEKVMLTTGHNLVEIKAKKQFIGKTLKELDLRRRFDVNVIAIQKKKIQVDEEGKVEEIEELNDVPSADYIIEEGDVLYIIGAEEDIERLATSEETKT